MVIQLPALLYFYSARYRAIHHFKFRDRVFDGESIMERMQVRVKADKIVEPGLNLKRELHDSIIYIERTNLDARND